MKLHEITEPPDHLSGMLDTQPSVNWEKLGHELHSVGGTTTYEEPHSTENKLWIDAIGRDDQYGQFHYNLSVKVVGDSIVLTVVEDPKDEGHANGMKPMSITKTYSYHQYGGNEEGLALQIDRAMDEFDDQVQIAAEGAPEEDDDYGDDHTQDDYRNP